MITQCRMPNERRALLIKKIVWMLFTLGVAGGIYFLYQATRSNADVVPSTTGAESLSKLVLTLHQSPGRPQSDQVAAALREIEKRYSQQVTLTTLDFNKLPKDTKLPGNGKPPYVVMEMGKQKVYEFSGYKESAQIRQKVDEILHGLERNGREWRPAVPGMTPAGQ